MYNIPYLTTDSTDINMAYRMAIGTLVGNILPYKNGILEEEKPVIIAGLGYVGPWTRDGAINVWNGGGLICPEIALNTLEAVVRRDEKGYFIAWKDYWDAIIWVTGAWNYYLFTGDKEFLKIAYEASCNSLGYFEETEFSEELNLFRGGACYGDGIAAYPDVYAQNGFSGIIHFAEYNRDLCVEKGVGIPIYTLSTNCLYYNAYFLADKMADELGLPRRYEEKTKNMKKAINDIFWNEEKGNYNYIYDDFGGCDYAEGMGLSFAILFDVASEEQKAKILKNTPVTAHGIACVYPSFPRYNTPDGMGFGRHSGTVWPQIQGFWADAAASNGERTVFNREFDAQTENAVRYYQFAEIYHPVTGEIYGGLQERGGNGIMLWKSQPCQTWSATAYLRNVYFDIIGMKFDTDGITFAPNGAEKVKHIELKSLKYRNAILNIEINGNGDKIAAFKIDGKDHKPFIPTDAKGEFNIEIELMS